MGNNSCCCGKGQVVPDPPSEQDIFDNLAGSERKLWHIAFSNMDSTKAGKLASDNIVLLAWLEENTPVRGEEEVKGAISRHGGDGDLDLQAFEKLMLNSCTDDAIALAVWQTMNLDCTDKMESADARTQLRVLGQSRLNLGGNWSEQMWDKVLDTALHNVDLQLDMETWVGRCAMFTRYVLALHQQNAASTA